MIKIGLISISMALMTTAAAAEPIHLRCANVSVSRPNPNAYYALVTVDLDTKAMSVATYYPGGGNTINYNITEADEQKVSAVGFDRSLGAGREVEQRIVLDRLSGRAAVRINDQGKWMSGPNFDCQPTTKRVF